MKRQGLIVTPKQLIDLAFELRLELKEQGNNRWNQKCQVNIINKKNKSDTWELENPADKI